MIKPRHISDDELQRVMKEPLARLCEGVVPAKRKGPDAHKTQNTKQTKRTETKHQDRTHQDKSRDKSIHVENPDTEILTFLISVHNHPWLSSTARRDKEGLTSDQFSRKKHDCLNANLAVDYNVNMGPAFGGNAKLLALTDAGFRAINETPKLVRRNDVSLEHWFWQLNWCRFQQTRFDAVIEKELNGKRADIAWLDSGSWHAGEVACSPANEVVNCMRNLEAGFSSIFVGCKNAAVRKAVISRLQAHLNSDQLDRIEVTLLADLWFADELAAEIRGVGR